MNIFSAICVFLASVSLNICAQNQNSGSYIPEGKWFVKPQVENSPANVDLFVPAFISNCESALLDPGSLFKNNSLFYSRSKLYKELFLELLLQTTAQDNVYAAEVSRKVSSMSTIGKMGIKFLGEAKVLNKSSIIYKELPYQLKLVSMVFSVDYKVQQAAVEAAALYASLSSFTEARYITLRNAMNYAGYTDQALTTGLNDAYSEISRLKEKDLNTLRSGIAANSSAEEVSGSLVKMATGGLFGNIISTLAGSGMISASLGMALPTAWFWQLGRTFSSEKAAASVVLLSTIDKAGLSKVPDPSDAADIYTLYQLRSQLSFMLLNAAKSYKLNNSCQSNFEELTTRWIQGWPYYDFSNLALMKQKALNELEILLPSSEEEITPLTPDEILDLNSGSFTDKRDGHVYKWIKIGDQIWMAENLSFKPCYGSFWPPDNSLSNIADYGYLYIWKTAQNVCPPEWHLPNIEEMRILLKNVGSTREEAYQALLPGGASGFSASLSGSVSLDYNGKRRFHGFKMQADYWSSTLVNYTYFSYAHILSVNGYPKEASTVDLELSTGRAVRCIKNKEK